MNTYQEQDTYVSLVKMLIERYGEQTTKPNETIRL